MNDLKMPEINYVMIAGNLTKDPVFRKTTNGTPVVNFTIASNRKFKDSRNEWQEDVCFVGVVAWNKLAESCKNRLRKGAAALIDGELQSRNWKNEDGTGRSVVEIKARRIQFLNKRGFDDRDDDRDDDGRDDRESRSNDDSPDYAGDAFDKFDANADSEVIRKIDEELGDHNKGV